MNSFSQQRQLELWCILSSPSKTANKATHNIWRVFLLKSKLTILLSTASKNTRRLFKCQINVINNNLRYNRIFLQRKIIPRALPSKTDSNKASAKCKVRQALLQEGLNSSIKLQRNAKSFYRRTGAAGGWPYRHRKLTQTLNCLSFLHYEEDNDSN